MAKSVVALYNDHGSARQAVRELIEDGFTPDAISLIFSGGSGGSGALLAATGIGLEIGGMNDGLPGALAGMDIPRELAQTFAEGVRRGGALITVAAPEERTSWVEHILSRYGPIDVERKVNEKERKSAGYGKNSPALTGLDRDFEEYEPFYRDHFSRSALRNEYRYEQFRPAYFYSFILASTYDHRETTWQEIEPAARRHWEDLDPGSWDRYGYVVKSAWDAARAAADGIKDG